MTYSSVQYIYGLESNVGSGSFLQWDLIEIKHSVPCTVRMAWLVGLVGHFEMHQHMKHITGFVFS